MLGSEKEGHVRTLIVASILLLAASGANAQIINGSNNGNNSIGLGTGNGNGNGNGNGSNNTTASTSSSGSGNVNVDSRGNTPAVVAPSLAAAGTESCLGSTSVGGAGPGFGVTIAGTMTDKGCNLRLLSRTLYNLGHRVAATQILCNDPDAALALRAEGVRCRVGIGAEIEAAEAARALASAEPAVATGASTSTSAAPAGRHTCQNYVLFQGCLDPPAPTVTAEMKSPPHPTAGPHKRPAKHGTPNG
jgi:hypothetical protein